MITGHGIDLRETDAIKRTYEKDGRFAKRVLTDKEFQCFLEQKSTKQQTELSAGRWATKEAFTKAVGTGIGTLGFKDIEILNNQLGMPVITRSPSLGKCFISLSHTGNLAQTSVTLEGNS